MCVGGGGGAQVISLFLLLNGQWPAAMKSTMACGISVHLLQDLSLHSPYQVRFYRDTTCLPVCVCLQKPFLNFFDNIHVYIFKLLLLFKKIKQMGGGGGGGHTNSPAFFSLSLLRKPNILSTTWCYCCFQDLYKSLNLFKTVTFSVSAPSHSLIHKQSLSHRTLNSRSQKCADENVSTSKQL